MSETYTTRHPSDADDAPTVTRGDRGATVLVSGALDVAAAPALRTTLLGLANEGCLDVQIDLRSVTFLDSTAIGVLVGAHRRTTQAGGALALVGPAPRVRRTLETLGLLPLFGLEAP